MKGKHFRRQELPDLATHSQKQWMPCAYHVSDIVPGALNLQRASHHCPSSYGAWHALSLLLWDLCPGVREGKWLLTLAVIAAIHTIQVSWHLKVSLGTLLHCWWECKLIQPLWKKVWRFLKTLGIKPPFDPAIPPLGIYPEETKIGKDTCIPLFIAAILTIARTWKQPWRPLTDEWIKKLWYIYTMEYYSVIKRNAFESVLMRWMNLEPII